MKNHAFVLAILASVLSVTLAFSHEKIEQVHSEVMSHVHNSMLDIPLMPRSTDQLACYDSFIPIIENITTTAKNKSEACLATSAGEKSNASSTLNANRSSLIEQVQKIQQSLSDCSKETDSIEYFRCLRDSVEENKRILDVIHEQAVSSLNFVKEVQSTENTCLRQAVDTAKNETDVAFGNLKKCLNYDML